MEGTALAVSDELYFPIFSTGTCTWIIATSDVKEWIERGGVITGVDTDQTSYRSKLEGQLGIAAFVDSIIIPIGEYHITTACNGLSALNFVGTNKEYIKCNGIDEDLLSITSELWERSTFNFTSKRVYTHQDEINTPLTITEILNCRMGLLANNIVLQHIDTRSPMSTKEIILGLGTMHCSGRLVISRI